MKVLVFSITAGQGHHSSAAALMGGLKLLGAECMMVDTLEYINTFLKGSVEYGYLASTKYSPNVYGAGYRLAEKHKRSKSDLSPVRNAARLLARRIDGLVSDFNPDAIVCTHSIAAHIVSYLKGVKANTYGIITDFTMHPLWEETNLDYYVTPSSLMANSLVKKGIDAKKMLPFGIPIDEKFSTKLSKEEACNILGIPCKTTVFFVSGSMGYGNMPRQIRKLMKLDMDFQIVAVSGRNDKMKKKIDEMAENSPKKIFSYGFVNNIDVIMDAADFMVTKPGGLTVSEGLAKGLPLILVNPIPGQEDRNVEFLLNNGLALLATSTFPIDECVFQLLNNNLHREAVLKNAAAAGKPYAARELAEFICREH